MKWLAAACLLIALTAHADAWNGTVIHIADGDTLTILDEERSPQKIRLAEIDAPEKGQAFGLRAKQALATLCFQEEVCRSPSDSGHS